MTIARYLIAPSSKVEILRKTVADDHLCFLIGAVRQHPDTPRQAVGIDTLTHHDLRHFVATRCIESGVDIPTASPWLGHSDGGALAMKPYGHLSQDQSQTQAGKVSFGLDLGKPAPAQPAGTAS